MQRLRTVVDSFWGACLGACFYAAWASWANWDAGVPIAVRAGLTHWALSVILTYTGTGAMRRLHRLGRGPLESGLLCFIGGLLYAYALLIGVHACVGTVHIALTLAAGVIPNLIFCGSYTLLLARTQPRDALGTVPLFSKISAHDRAI